jgi:iron complex transport system ATP-binding protein
MTRVLEIASADLQRGSRRVLANVSFHVDAGEVVALVGPNGSGKTTLLRALAGIDRVAHGEVRMDGTRLDAFSRRAIARQLAYLPQDTRCDFAFTVEEVAAMGRYAYRSRTGRAGADDQQAVEAALEACDLGSLRRRTVDRLSGGERQRVALARCLASAPRVLLLDEPTAHLDPEHAGHVVRICRTRAARGTTVVIATHDLAAAAQVASRVVVLAAGGVAIDGPPFEVLTSGAARRVFGVDAVLATTASGEQHLCFSQLT